MKLLGLLHRNKQGTTDFSRFFYSASSKQKEKVISSAIKKANKDQKKLEKTYQNLKK